MIKVLIGLLVYALLLRLVSRPLTRMIPPRSRR